MVNAQLLNFYPCDFQQYFSPTVICGPTGQQEYSYPVLSHHFLVWKTTESLRQLSEKDDRLQILVPTRDTVNGLAGDFLSLALQQLLITISAAMAALVASLPNRQKMSCSRLSKAGAAVTIAFPILPPLDSHLGAKGMLLPRCLIRSHVNIQACQ